MPADSGYIWNMKRGREAPPMGATPIQKFIHHLSETARLSGMSASFFEPNTLLMRIAECRGDVRSGLIMYHLHLSGNEDLAFIYEQFNPLFDAVEHTQILLRLPEQTTQLWRLDTQTELLLYFSPLVQNVLVEIVTRNLPQMEREAARWRNMTQVLSY